MFPKSDADYYLPRYWLGKHVSKQAKGFPERAYAKWLVIHFIWQRLSPVLRKKALRHVFATSSESGLSPTLRRGGQYGVYGR